MRHYAALYKKELLENVIPFWMKYSKDEEQGGFYTCLDRYGNVFDTDKFIWLQGRETWLFSMLYDKVEKKEAWLEMALHGASFLQRHGRDEQGNWYFSLTREGKPLIQPYSIFSDCFAAMGFGALYKATGNDDHATIARDTFTTILKRRNNPKGIYYKGYPGTRDLKSFSLPMILCNLSLEMEHLLDQATVKTLIEEVVAEVMETFYQEDLGLILENVNPDGSFSDSFEGRIVNPGHGIEAMWFIMDLGVRLGNRKLIEKALSIALHTLDYSWDKTHGGIFYFLDAKGKPLQQLEWDQKLWWVHVETLVCLAKGYALTGSEEAKQWFEKVHEYAWKHFRDEEYGEWFGYLDRRGEVLLPLKGGKWKGCFHVPRALYQVAKTLGDNSENLFRVDPTTKEHKNKYVL
jgi:N-acylglucosamine 2-epimerase